MKKWIILILAAQILTACNPAVELSPDVEPALTTVLEGKITPTAVPTIAVEPTNTAEPTATVIAEPPQETDIVDSADSTKSDAIAGDMFLIFHRSGGFAGVDQKWIVYADGRIEFPDGTEKQVDSEQMRALLDTFQSARFFELNESYVPLDNCCDRFNYSITVQIDGQSKTVNTIDDAPKQPEQLTTIMEAINSLLVELE